MTTDKETPMTTVADDLLTRIDTRPGASFAELQRVLADLGHDTRGTYEMSLPNRADLVLWAGLSDALTEALATVEHERSIHLHVLTTDFEVIVVYMGVGAVMARSRPGFTPLRPHVAILSRSCAWCGGSLHGLRRDARYCSVSHRVLACRKRRQEAK